MSYNTSEDHPQFLVTNGKIYGVCDVVQLNKPLFGSYHFCTTEDERKQYPKSIARKVSLNRAALVKARQA